MRGRKLVVGLHALPLRAFGRALINWTCRSLHALFIALVAAQMVNLAAWAAGRPAAYRVPTLADCRQYLSTGPLAFLPDYTRLPAAPEPQRYLAQAPGGQANVTGEAGEQDVVLETAPEPVADQSVDEPLPTEGQQPLEEKSLALDVDSMVALRNEALARRSRIQLISHQIGAPVSHVAMSLNTRANGVSALDVELKLASAHPEVPPQDRRQIAQHLVEVAGEYKLDPWILYSLIEVESDFRISVRGQAGEYGLMQLMPGTARELARNVKGIHNLDLNRLYEPRFNMELGAAYLDWQLKRYNGNLALALTAYNQGSTRGVVSSYARKVLRVYDEVTKEAEQGKFAAV